MNLVGILFLTLSTPSFAEDTKVLPSWELMGESDGARAFRREIPGSRFVAFRGEMDLDATIPQIVAVLRDSARKKDWIAKTVEAYTIERLGPWESWEYNHTRGVPILVNDRDFTFRAKLTFDLKKRVVEIHLKSAVHPDHPPRDGIVRGEIVDSLYRMTELDGGKRTHLEVEIQADPKGSVPGWLVNLFQKSWPHNTLHGIRNQTKRPDLIPDTATSDVLSGRVKSGFLVSGAP